MLSQYLEIVLDVVGDGPMPVLHDSGPHDENAILLQIIGVRIQSFRNSPVRKALNRISEKATS
jgi:hypothetical protein